MKKKISILIADDNKLMRETLGIFISGIKNFQIAGEARNGVEAIALSKDLSPDIILMDVNMSPVNGFEATRKIIKQNPAAKIIGFSLFKIASYAKNMLQSGANGYISKSASLQEIIGAIKIVAAGGKYIDKDLAGKI